MRLALCASLLFLTGIAHAKNVDVYMKNNGKDGLMAFEPGFVQIEPGDTVTFIPGDMTHNSASFLAPDGSKGWTGKMDQKLTVKPDKEGVYLYRCDPHLPMGMVGVIQVGKASNLDRAKQEAEKVSKNFAMNKDRLLKYLALVK